MSIAAPPSIQSSANSVIDPNDPLGYDAYAKTLWTRIDLALNRDANTGKLGDDPLVIGLFGEWGVGKTYLLDKIRDQAAANSNILAERHRTDGGFDLLIPVYFQPWKYEHEEHLHVPLLLHTLKALEEVVTTAQPFFDRVCQTAQKPGDAIVGSLPSLVTGFKKLFVSTVAAMEPTTGVVMATATLAAETTAANAKKRPPKPDVASALKYTGDGRYFYDIHKILKGITRPAKHAGALPEIVILNPNFKVNFVVFVDDLDRCLPEKAVQVLELIKTVFNVDSFAFVLALDDEVIERGIGHRYKDYTFENKKPQMPITGFEYLEKIVHLPFRLPPLTRDQAVTFVRFAEMRAEPDAALHWFAVVEPIPLDLEPRSRSPSLIDMIGDGAKQSFDWMRADTESPLLKVLLTCFDAYVPRKLLRAVELWHQVCRVARERGVADLEKNSLKWARRHERDAVALDTHVIFALVLLQLFQPDLFRLMRRRRDAFPILLNALSGSTTAPGGLNKVEVSDVDLWSWASFRAGEQPDKPVSRPSSESEAIKLIATLGSNEAYLAQHIRLRIAERLVEHFSAQRHTFNPLKLMHWIANAVEAKPFESANTMPAYFSVLAQVPDSLDRDQSVALRPDTVASGTTAHADVTLGELTATSRASTTELRLPTFAPANLDALFEALISPETASRGGIQDRFSLPTKQTLDAGSAQTLRQRFADSMSSKFASSQPVAEQDFVHVAGAVAAIAPWLDWAKGGRSVFATLGGSVTDGSQTSHALIDEVLAAAPTPKSRAAVGDLLERFAGGDPRFNPDARHLLVDRYPGSSLTDEMIPGFVRIPAGTFTMGHVKESNSQPHDVLIENDFYMARMLTTVGQYARFIEADGYTGESEAIWSSQGLEWLSGQFDSKVKNKEYHSWLEQRPKEKRSEPWTWNEQRAHPSRPVIGVSWFEARAYARWLNLSLFKALDETTAKALHGYEVMLPTEAQWERASRAKRDGNTLGWHKYRWPWGEDEALSKAVANVEDSGIGSTSSVGALPASDAGLYDMAGNVWEWMDNVYSPKSIATSYSRWPDALPLKTNVELDKCDRPSLRGGSWLSGSGDASCSCRGKNLPGGSGYGMGVRVVLSLAEK